MRTDRHDHRLIAGDSPTVEAIKVLARGHQNLIWARTDTPMPCVGRYGSTTPQR
ncbi:putative transposase [Mycobacterium kansasii 732]|nr:putative transposase [Mycobacterium kansasii 732]